MLNPIKKIFAHKKISVLLIVALAIGGYYSYKALNPQKTAVSYTTAAAQIGTVIQSVSGTGQISASNKIDLKAKTAGDVALVNVSSGQAVKQGDVLVKIDSSDATQAVKDAQIALETAQLNLEKLLKPVDELTLMQAQNSLTQAQDTKSNAQDSLAKSYDDAFNDIGGA
ncbi:MAG: biotin/lipoyl-binding protein, partial [Candidatus Nealsonbacteria bacterium]|nr:biotin/lipoyl-binding protein [Candidatus Nealsonbacteria bacterium]